MKNREILFLLGIMAVITAGISYVISLANYQLWISLILYSLNFVVVIFMVFFVESLIERWQSHRRKIKRLLNVDKRKINQRNHLQKNQSEIIDYNLSERLVDFELVKEEVESIRKNLLNSIEYEEASIVKKEQIIEGYKQLLNELNGVNDNGKNVKETKTL